MPKIRGAAGTTINTSVVITVCAFVLLMVAVFLQRELRRKRRTQYHPPLQLETTSGGVLEQIGRRKEDIRRYIDKLKEQLAVREDQLRYHNELEEIVTSRVETSRVDEEEWTNLMKAGRKLHGKKWNASNGDEPSLMELMEIHKEELLEYKRSLKNKPRSSRQRSTERSASRETKADRSSKFNLPLLKLQPVAPLPSASHGTGATMNPGQTKLVSTQWQSTRLTAQSRTAAMSARLTPFQSDGPDGNSDTSPPTLVPPLDFTRLGGGPIVVVPTENTEEPLRKEKRKSFEATFQRQTRLAAMLRKKK